MAARIPSATAASLAVCIALRATAAAKGVTDLRGGNNSAVTS